jgi:hypothetical protein
MKKLVALLALAQILTLPALAQAQSGRTRAEVSAEALSANRAGQLTHGDDINFPDQIGTAGRQLTRAEVKADTRAAAAAGDLHSDGEIGAMPSPASDSHLTRAQVKAETRAALASGELQRGGDLDQPATTAYRGNHAGAGDNTMPAAH